MQIDKLKVGDIILEWAYGCKIQSEVITTPAKDSNGLWTWKSITEDGNVIDYAQNENYGAYSLNLTIIKNG